MKNNIEDRFRINFESDPLKSNEDSKFLREMKRTKENNQTKTEFVNGLKLNKYSRIVMLVTNPFLFHKLIKTKSTEYIKVIFIFNSFAYLCGMMLNMD